MKNIDLRYQIALFGNFDDVTPNINTIKYFIDVYSDRDLIPNQYHEVSLDAVTGAGSKGNRLSLTSEDQSFNIRFGFDRMDVMLTNNNINVTTMKERDAFIDDFKNIYDHINSKFPKKIKRIGLVSQYLISGVDLSQVASSFFKLTKFHEKPPLIEFNNKIVNRTTIDVPEEEILNVAGELRWLKTNLQINNKNEAFEGLLFATDINTIPENAEYRFDKDKIDMVLRELSRVAKLLESEYINILEHLGNESKQN